MTFNTRWIIGKTIAKIDMHPFETSDSPGASSRPQFIAHAPVITFTDGSSIRFGTEETEVGEYGTAIIYQKARGRS